MDLYGLAVLSRGCLSYLLDSFETSSPVSCGDRYRHGTVVHSYTDHLNTPRLVADATGTTVWRWDQQEPFGNNPAAENPSGLGAFDLPLRLPGQYLDKETNLHYNHYRDYDPLTGGYIQSDPIGTVIRRGMPFASPVFRVEQPSDVGGMQVVQRFLPKDPAYNHLYVYTLNNPIRWTDPLGLLCADENYWKCMGWATLCPYLWTPCLLCTRLPPPWNGYCLGGCVVGTTAWCIQEIDKMCTAQHCPPSIPVVSLPCK